MSWPFLFLITIGIAATLGVFADCVIVNMHCKLVAECIDNNVQFIQILGPRRPPFCVGSYDFKDNDDC